MKNRKLKDSFKNAFNGIFLAYKTEKNMRYHSVMGIFSIALATFLEFDRIEWAMLILTISFVFVAELLNTAIEYAIDMVCGSNYSDTAKYAKDIAAGATLFAAFCAIVMALFLYLPKIAKLFLY